AVMTSLYFFFQAEDGIRDRTVTGVQTCALPILHVHMNYGGAYHNTPGHLAAQARAEDLHVVENLIVNKEQRIPDISYFRTDADRSEERRVGKEARARSSGSG